MPFIPFVEVVGKAAKVPPKQIGATAVNVCVIVGFTMISNVVPLAHCPESDAKV